MKKIILLALTALMMVGCNVKHRPQYGIVHNGNNWAIFLINDSTYLMIPKYKEYHTPFILKDILKEDSCRFCKERDSIKWEKRKKELLEELN